MNLLEKIELIINTFLLRLGNLIGQGFLAIIPAPLKRGIYRVTHQREQILLQLKQAPAQLKAASLRVIPQIRPFLQSLNLKQKLKHTYQEALRDYQIQKSAQINNLKKFALAPVLIISKWLQGLSAGQTLLLLSFSAASFLAGINIFFTSQRMLGQQHDASRAPASTPEDITYDRATYYKENTRHFNLSNLRLPVYVAELNELKSVDIDFTAIVSNRQSRQFLEKHEFQLRDHLILEMEPLIASFPLLDEGKEVIRDKVHQEINLFLQAHKIQGEVSKLRLTYILAN